MKNNTNSRLLDCYNQLKDILGEEIEPYESVELVETYRRYWKPDKVRIVLLAESHLYTTKEHSEISIQLSKITQLPKYPTKYAKFVYCLAYGEKQLINSNIKGNGTPQFWKIFYSCIHPINGKEEFSPILSNTPDEQRLKNKVELLLLLKNKGIWLVDASIVALYNPEKKNKKPEYKKMCSAILKSWECYTSNIVKETSPEHIICIGHGVSKLIRNDIIKVVGNCHYTVIAQPNAHLSSEDHMNNYKSYNKICMQYI